MKRFTFTDSAKADLRRIEKDEALVILKALARFGREGAGDVKKLVDDPQGRLQFRHAERRERIRITSARELT